MELETAVYLSVRVFVVDISNVLPPCHHLSVGFNQVTRIQFLKKLRRFNFGRVLGS